MTTTDQTATRQLRLPHRLAMLAGGVLLAGLLVAARRLEPDPAGYGTHRQLGLPPCTLVVTLGRPCPSCGMTTSWAYLLRGGIRDAARANSGGLVLGILAVAGGPWLVVSALAGRWIGTVPTERVVLIMVVAIAAVTMLDWTRRCFAPELW